MYAFRHILLFNKSLNGRELNAIANTVKWQCHRYRHHHHHHYLFFTNKLTNATDEEAGC